MIYSIATSKRGLLTPVAGQDLIKHQVKLTWTNDGLRENKNMSFHLVECDGGLHGIFVVNLGHLCFSAIVICIRNESSHQLALRPIIRIGQISHSIFSLQRLDLTICLLGHLFFLFYESLSRMNKKAMDCLDACGSRCHMFVTFTMRLMLHSNLMIYLI